MLERIFDFLVADKPDEHVRGDDLIVQLDQCLVHMDGHEASIMFILDFVGKQFLIMFFEGFGGAFTGGYVEDAGIDIFLSLSVFQFHDDIDSDVFDHL